MREARERVVGDRVDRAAETASRSRTQTLQPSRARSAAAVIVLMPDPTSTASKAATRRGYHGRSSLTCHPRAYDRIAAMLLREVSYARPGSVEEAVALLSEHDGARALAGGQTLVNVMKQRAASPDVLVDLADLDELRTIAVSGTTLELGAMATLTSIIRSSEVEVGRPILGEVAATIADVQVRNRGTIGGNICVNDPTNHFPPLLVALGATMTIRSASGERRCRPTSSSSACSDGGRRGRPADADHVPRGPGRATRCRA